MKIRKLSMMLLAFMCVLNMSCVMAFAESEPDKNHKHGTESSATISEEVDKASNKDPKMSTSFYMYCPPDPTFEDIPKMGDSGIDTTMLLASTLVTGAAFISVTKYGYKDKKENDSDGDKA